MEATLSDSQSEVARLRHELQSVAVEDKDDGQITIADYLLARLEQLGVTVYPSTEPRNVVNFLFSVHLRCTW